MSVHELFTDLDDLLSGPEPDFDAEPAALLEADHADRALRHLARLRREEEDAEELANTERARIDLWLSVQRERIAKQRRWFEDALAAYHSNVLARDAKAKTIRLPNGTLVARARQAEWQFDEPAFLRWAAEHAPDLIRQKPAPAPEVDRNAAKRALSSTPDGFVVGEGGEIVPGVRVEQRGVKFVVEVARD